MRRFGCKRKALDDFSQFSQIDLLHNFGPGTRYGANLSLACMIMDRRMAEEEEEECFTSSDDVPNGSWTVVQLKEFLRAHGGRLGGRKSSLVERALFYSTHPYAATTKRSTIASGSSSSWCSGTRPEFPLSGWSSSAKGLPSVSVSTILEHLLRTGKCESADEVTVVQKPLRRGQDFFFAGYIHDVKVAREKGSVFITSKCWASQKKSQKYEQRLAFTESHAQDAQGDRQSPSIAFASCLGCPAGENGGLCHHVFALLLVIECYAPKSDTVTSQLSGAESVTSQPCSWGPRKRDVEPKPIMQTFVEKSKIEDERKRDGIGCCLYECRLTAVQTLTPSEISDLTCGPDFRMKKLLFTDFMTSETSYGLAPVGSALSHQLVKPPLKGPVKSGSALHPTAQQVEMPSGVRFPALPLVLHERRALCDDELEWPIDLHEAQLLERKTVGQSLNAAWCHLHTFVLTSSRFKTVIWSKVPTEKLLLSLFARQNIEHVASIQHGRKYEGAAIKEYTSRKSAEGTPVVVRQCGMASHTQFRFLGASPDGMVFDQTASPRFGLLEVKCPYAAFNKSLTVQAACNKLPAFCCTVQDGSVKLREDHEYYYQVQGQLAVCSAKWCDFVVWLGKDMSVQRIAYDDVFWNTSMLPCLLNFYSRFALPFLHARKAPTALGTQDHNADLSFRQSERLLDNSLCQSRIEGRNGSSACTVICTVFCAEILYGNVTITRLTSDTLINAMCQAMISGNALYDQSGTVGLLSADEVLERQLVPGVQMDKELFARPSSLSTMVAFIEATANAAPSHITAGLLIITPLTFAVASNGTHFLLFDSHGHGDKGALIAEVSIGEATSYLEYFFQHHQPVLRFTKDLAEKVAHLTLLKVVGH